MTEMESQGLIMDYIMDYTYLSCFPLAIEEKDGVTVFASAKQKDQLIQGYLQKKYGNHKTENSF